MTSWWGEITISRLGSATDRRLVALHEAVHRALTPKLDVLRHVRVQGRAASYTRSSFAMYLEEALAESFAQVSAQGIRHLVTGIVFPVRNGYVSLFARKAANGMRIEPVMPEVIALYLGIVNVEGWILDAYFSDRRPEGR
jgi:hypothetical protein